MNQWTEKEREQFQKAPYQSPEIRSKKVEFMTNTFSTPYVEAAVEFGPHREPPRRPGH